jgi:hypothetical protein
MGYIFAIGVVVMWAVMLHTVAPFVTYYILPILVGFIVLLWMRSRIAEQNEMVEREKRRRQIVLDIAAAFWATGAKFLVDHSSAVFSFESEIDAELAATKVSGRYFKYWKGYVVVTRDVTDSELQICKTFLGEALLAKSPGVDTEIPRFTPVSIPESEAARSLRNERISKLQNERNSIKVAMLSNIETRTKADFPESATAVYVFASKVACKVGISDDPERRLRQIQTGHPSELRIVKSWWFASTNDAALVEKSVHGLLKVLGAHASGEWFSASPSTVLEHVRKVIVDLVETSEIDRSLQALGARQNADTDVSLAKLATLPWKVSRKGNEWLQLDAHHVVVFKTRGGYSFRYKEKFSDEKFRTRADAKAAALHAILLNARAKE